MTRAVLAAETVDLGTKASSLRSCKESRSVSLSWNLWHLVTEKDGKRIHFQI